MTKGQGIDIFEKRVTINTIPSKKVGTVIKKDRSVTVWKNLFIWIMQQQQH